MAERGRPSDYTDELAMEICERLSQGITLREICKADDMPHESTVRRWAVLDYNGFYTHYAKAREIGYQAMADELLEISDDGTNDWMQRNAQGDDAPGYVINGEHVQRSRLRIDTRKWLMAKALPKVYGDKLEVDNKHDLSDPLSQLLSAVAQGSGRIGARRDDD